jgi:hypothetical protein
MKLFGLTIRKKYFFPENATLSQMFDENFKLVKNGQKVLGMNVFDENHNYFNFLFVVLICDIVTYMGINFYDIYLFRNDMVRDTFCLVTLGMVSIYYWLK